MLILCHNSSKCSSIPIECETQNEKLLRTFDFFERIEAIDKVDIEINHHFNNNLTSNHIPTPPVLNVEERQVVNFILF